MKLLLLSVLVAVAIGMSQARPSWEIEWNDWKIKFGKIILSRRCVTFLAIRNKDD